MIGRKKHWTKKIGQVHGDKKLHQIISHFQRFFRIEQRTQRQVENSNQIAGWMLLCVFM